MRTEPFSCPDSGADALRRLTDDLRSPNDKVALMLGDLRNAIHKLR